MKNSQIIFSLLLIVSSLIFPGCAAIYGSYYTDDPLTAEEHNNLGVIYESEGKYDLALREYKRAISLDGQLIVPLVNIGNVYVKQGKYDKAEKYYKKALGKDKHNTEAANNLASVYIETGENYEEGIETLLAATESQKPVPAYALDTLGVLYFKTGNTEKARESLKEACMIASGEDKLKSEISAHLREIGDINECK